MLPQEKIHQNFIKKEKTLALAESCSGGYLAAKFITIPNASKYFLGSFVTYSNVMKEKVLHVSAETLRISGSVSREVTDEMWIGLMKISQADFGIAITGIAGPTGGTKEKPIGTVFIALGTQGKKPYIVECHFKGERKAIIEAICQRALEELIYLI